MLNLDPIRCPYCVEGNHFKIMTEAEGGLPLKCGRCGHLVAPKNPLFKCACVKCFALDRSIPGMARPKPSSAQFAGRRRMYS